MLVLCLDEVWPPDATPIFCEVTLQNGNEELVEDNNDQKTPLLRPIVMLISGVVIAGFVAGVLLINSGRNETKESDTSVNYTGKATVVSFNSNNKYCYAVLRHDDGYEVRHRLARATCKHLEEGTDIDIVDGQYNY